MAPAAPRVARHQIAELSIEADKAVDRADAFQLLVFPVNAIQGKRGGILRSDAGPGLIRDGVQGRAQCNEKGDNAKSFHGTATTYGNLIGVFLSSRSAAAAWADETRAAGKKVVITNGVFDLLHPGHVRYLQAARRQGDALLVAINSDRSVSAIKGPARPLTPESERAEILDALACVDAVVVFDEETPAEIIAAVRPDVLVKGADWAPDKIVGRDTVEALGGKVVLMPVEEGWSTTSIIAKVQALSK